MSKFTNVRDAVTLELGSWLIRKLISKLEEKYGRESTSAPPNPDRTSTVQTTDGSDGEETGRAGSKGG